MPKNRIRGILLGYHLVYEELQEKSNTTVVPNATEVQLFGLRKFTVYSITIAAFTSKGNGPFSQAVLCSTNQDSETFFLITCSILLFYSNLFSKWWRRNKWLCGEGPFNPVRYEMGRDHLSWGVRGGKRPFNPVGCEVGWGLFILWGMKWGETIYPEGCEVGRDLLILWGMKWGENIYPEGCEVGRDLLILWGARWGGVFSS